MTFEETAAAILAADRKAKDDARRAREAAKRKGPKPESRTAREAKDSAYRQAFRDWASADVQEWERRFLPRLPVYVAPVSAIMPFKR